jgi:NAD(P)-dependent dehydrogenase (short-subunit alcohol dehydrogenase family)
MKSILITGASSGFGMETAIELAGKGWRVFATMRNPGKARDLLDAAKTSGVAARIRVLELDVTNPGSIDGALRRVLAETGGTLDALLNNAGFGELGFFEDLTDADCRRVMDTNFFGSIAVTRSVIPVMRRAGNGRIAFVSSNAVNAPHPTMTMYAASKWALEGFAEALAMELAPFGVEVVVLQPGNHRTAFAAHVNMVRPAGGAYDELWNSVMPGLERLGARGRDARRALPAFVEALDEPRPRFRRMIGNDTRLFAGLKGCLPYEVRAWALRRFVGFPGRSHRRSSSAGVR